MFGFQTFPAAFDFVFERLQRFGVFRLRQVAGFAHHLQPVGNRNPLVSFFRIVRDRRFTVLDFIQREEAAVDRVLDDLLAELAPPTASSADR